MRRRFTLLLPVVAVSLLGCRGILVHKPEIKSLSGLPKESRGFTGLEFKALVTDPEGLADVLTGDLSNVETSAPYGSFLKTGAYWELWLDLEQIADIEPFEAGDERIFEARFFDRVGHESQPATVSVTLVPSST